MNVSFSQRHAVQGGPEIEDVAFGTAVGMKALEQSAMTGGVGTHKKQHTRSVSLAG